MDSSFSLNLGSQDLNERILAWDDAINLLSQELVDTKTVLNFKQSFIELLTSNNERIRFKAWGQAIRLAEFKILSQKELHELKTYLVDLLTSKDISVRLDAWLNTSIFYENKFLNTVDLRGVKYYLLELMRSNDLSTRLKAFQAYAYSDINVRIFSSAEIYSLKSFYYELLKSKDLNIRAGAWSLALMSKHLDNLIILSFPSTDSYLLESLAIEDISKKIRIWQLILYYLSRGFLSPEKVKPYKENLINILGTPLTGEERIDLTDLILDPYLGSFVYIFDKRDIINLLTSKDLVKRARMWTYVYLFVYADVIKERDLRDLVTYYLDTLSLKEPIERVYAWLVASLLTDIKVVAIENVRERINYFLELLTDKDLQVRSKAWTIASTLIAKGILTEKEAKERKNFLIELLTAEDKKVRTTNWIKLSMVKFSEIVSMVKFPETEGIFPTLFDLNILLDREDYERIKPYLLELLKDPNEKLRIHAWGALARLQLMKEARDFKKYYLKLLTSDYIDIRALAWSIIPVYHSAGVITEGEIIERKRYFLSLLNPTSHKTMKMMDERSTMIFSWNLLVNLMKMNIIQKEDVEEKVKLLFERKLCTPELIDVINYFEKIKLLRKNEASLLRNYYRECYTRGILGI